MAYENKLYISSGFTTIVITNKCFYFLCVVMSVVQLFYGIAILSRDELMPIF